MKKITLFLMGLILSIGCINAQSSFPTLSTNDSGPWYYVKVIGSGDDRENRYWTVDKRQTTNFTHDVYRVFGEHALATSFEDVEKQLFRFEDAGEGNYMIINKGTGLNVDQMYWENNKNRPITILSDDPITDWRIEEQINTAEIYPSSTKDYPGYFRIMPTMPDLSPNHIYAHQGNGGFEWTVVFETAQWGVGPNSSFYFIEYEDPGLLCPQAEPGKGPDFKYRAKNADFVTDTIRVLGFPSLTTDIDITYSIDIDDPDSPFTVTPRTGWDNKQGGILEVYYYPQAVGDHTMTVTISAQTVEGPVNKEVLVQGKTREKTPDNFKASPSIANTDADTWYSIQFDQRTGFYLRDVGVDKMLEAYPGFKDQENTPEQLWKFVTIAGNDTAYVLVNKVGHQLEYVTTVEPNDETGEDIITSRFHAATTSENTFGFNLRTNDGGYQIQWNQYYVDLKDEDGKLTGEKENRRTYINKTNPDDGFGQHNSLTDEGNSIVLHEYGKGTFVDSDFPITSTASNPVWYYVQFYRAITATNKVTEQIEPNAAMMSQGLGTEEAPVYVIQGNIDQEKANTAFYWRFEGEWNNFKLIDYDGNEFAIVKQAESTLQPTGEGANFKFVKFAKTANWQIACLDSEDKYSYLNDYSGSNYQVGGYTAGNDGAEIVLTLVKDYNPGAGIETPEGEIDGTAIGYVYYTLQGIQLTGEPKTDGLYILKTIYADKKATAKTVYIINK